MIFDRLDNAPRYRSLSPRFAAALDFLARPNLAALPEGKTDLIPGEVWAAVMRKPARAAAPQFEVHRRFADIQCCVAGKERIGWHADLAALRVAAEFDADKDVEMRQGPATDFLPMSPGWFAILFPGEPHASMIGVGPLTKVVLKVLIA